VEFIIDKKFFRTPFYIKCLDNGSFIKTTTVPDNSIIVGSPEFYLLSKLYNFSYPYFPPIKYKRSFEELMNTKEVPWEFVLPSNVYSTEIQKCIQKLREIFDNLDLIYYNKIFKKNTVILENLKAAKIDSTKFFSTALAMTNEDAHFKTFTPQKGGFASIPSYNRVSTKTGRLTITKGPNILHLEKKHRNILTSRFGKRNGKIFYLDYSSLEPRVLLAIMGKENIPKDIYQSVLDDLEYDIPREAIKQTIISRLYGAGTNTIARQLQKLVDYPRDVITLVDKYFGIEELKEKLLSEFTIKGGRLIKNYYGRPVHCEGAKPYVLLNYFIQSTAVDISLLGFTQIWDKIKEAEIQHLAAPLFVLHDGIFLDVNREIEHLIPKLCKVGSYDIPRFENTNFWLGIENEY
jgi:hypothetical protein